MAYDTTKLVPARSDRTLWEYETTIDVIEDIEKTIPNESGRNYQPYFDSEQKIREGDFIRITAKNGKGLYQVSSIGSHETNLLRWAKVESFG